MVSHFLEPVCSSPQAPGFQEVPALAIEDILAQPGLGRRVALLGGLFQPVLGLALLVQGSIDVVQRLHSLGIAGLGLGQGLGQGLLTPAFGILRTLVAGDAGATLKEAQHGVRVALFSGLEIPVHGFLG